MRFSILLCGGLFFFPSFLWAQGSTPATPLVATTVTLPPPKPWANETEIAIVSTSGNTESSTYSGKQKTTYAFDFNAFTINGNYLKSQTGGAVTAQNWAAGLRYDLRLSALWSNFVAYLVEADPYSGIIQRNSEDLGVQYLMRKTLTETWTSEVGLRNSDTYDSSEMHNDALFGRLQSAYQWMFHSGATFNVALEFLPNFRDPLGYLANGSISVTTLISQVFSLKMGYEGKYQNAPPAPATKYLDTIFTSSIVAKF